MNIPKHIYQTYHDKTKIPQKVYDNIAKYAPEYTQHIFDDTECLAFLERHFDPLLAKTFREFKVGAHKADLWRYCVLYVHGGVYLDIKTELIRPLSDIFKRSDTLYTCLSIVSDTIYQGIIATPPKNPIFLELIHYIVITNPEPKQYMDYTAHLYQVLNRHFVQQTFLDGARINFYLLQERCSNDPKDCPDKLDRYQRCCYIHDSDGSKAFKVRYADFPW